MTLFTYILASITILYVVVIATIIISWILIPEKEHDDGKIHSTSVTVIIVARNEENNIERCLSAIIAQKYDRSLLEVIVVDDHSTDRTFEIVNEVCSSASFIKMIKSDAPPESKAFKKHGIGQAITVSKGELIVTTDADCTMGPLWINELVGFYESNKPSMIIGTVCIDSSRSIFGKFQAVEFTGLMVAAGAMANLKKPIMCNGANLAYTRESFEKVKGFEAIDQKASGDDVMLMNKINGCFPGAVKFIKSNEAIVYTNSLSSLRGFINQRVRWSSKTVSGGNRINILVAAVVYFFNFFALISMLILPFNAQFFGLFMPPLFSAFIINFLLLFLGLSFFGIRRYWWIILPEQPLYILYVVWVGLISIFNKKYTWKGRKLV